MLLSAASVLVVAQPSSEAPEGLMNYSVYIDQYFPRFHVTTVGLGTYYPQIRRHTCTAIACPMTML
jgi:hypothetical protein